MKLFVCERKSEKQELKPKEIGNYSFAQPALDTATYSRIGGQSHMTLSMQAFQDNESGDGAFVVFEAMMQMNKADLRAVIEHLKKICESL